jgi:hypothetical protein
MIIRLPDQALPRGSTEEPRAALNKALDLDPGFQPARSALDALGAP